MTSEDASNLIESAIIQSLKSHEHHLEDDILIDWVVVAYVTNPDMEQGSGYPTFFSNGEMPSYRARGLLETGLLTLSVPE
jgi:hypothetical protein